MSMIRSNIDFDALPHNTAAITRTETRTIACMLRQRTNMQKCLNLEKNSKNYNLETSAVV